MRPAAPRTVHIVMPGTVADPAAPSGGNVYDLRVCRDLPGTGWEVQEHAVAGDWPQPGPAARAELARILGGLPDGTAVLLDGLVACALPYIVVPQAQRLRLAVLVHLPLGDETGLAPGRAADLGALEGRTLRSARTVVATSAWAAGRLVELHGLVPDRVHVAAPGADIAPLAASGDDGSRLLCVASVTPRKGQLRLVEALARIGELPWSCDCVGALDQDPEYADRLRESIEKLGVADRVHLLGARTGAQLDAGYGSADAMVLASYAETYGMAVTEALARGIPVLATAVGGVPEAVGQAPDGRVPGMLIDPDDPEALTAALRRWLGDPGLRRRLTAAAHERRTALAGWANTTRNLAGALEQLLDEPRRAA
ncbi:D-inositol 3-phosphate glycosyltransferase [Streptomyces malaysiensis subsp. malaysiensis]|nr:D-inositol 3-phosphate glycosyltransferase [Streptomyces sp. M56]